VTGPSRYRPSRDSRAALGLGRTAGAAVGGRKVKAITTAPIPIAHEATKSQK
jgi:hypothetical protein